MDHFYKIYNNKVLNSKKKKIIEILHETKVDFRMLTAFKNALFDSDDLQENHLIPLSSWKSILIYEMQYCLSPCEDLILEECLMKGEMVNLQKFVDIVDLFMYLPM